MEAEVINNTNERATTENSGDGCNDVVRPASNDVMDEASGECGQPGTSTSWPNVEAYNPRTAKGKRTLKKTIERIWGKNLTFAYWEHIVA